MNTNGRRTGREKMSGRERRSRGRRSKGRRSKGRRSKRRRAGGAMKSIGAAETKGDLLCLREIAGKIRGRKNSMYLFLIPTNGELRETLETMERQGGPAFLPRNCLLPARKSNLKGERSMGTNKLEGERSKIIEIRTSNK